MYATRQCLHPLSCGSAARVLAHRERRELVCLSWTCRRDLGLRAEANTVFRPFPHIYSRHWPHRGTPNHAYNPVDSLQTGVALVALTRDTMDAMS